MGMSDARPLRWTVHSTERGPDLLVARARFDVVENPRTGEHLRRLVLEAPEWCNIVALTPERRMVVVRQFRFGTGTVTTEIPGGVVDSGETRWPPGRGWRRGPRESPRPTGWRRSPGPQPSVVVAWERDVGHGPVVLRRGRNAVAARLGG